MKVRTRAGAWAWVWGLMLGAGLLATPAWGHDHRTDRCGCHHQYGLRHCHPTKKTTNCEAPAKAEAPARTDGKATPKSAPRARPTTRL